MHTPTVDLAMRRLAESVALRKSSTHSVGALSLCQREFLGETTTEGWFISAATELGDIFGDLSIALNHILTGM